MTYHLGHKERRFLGGSLPRSGSSPTHCPTALGTQSESEVEKPHLIPLPCKCQIIPHVFSTLQFDVCGMIHLWVIFCLCQ